MRLSRNKKLLVSVFPILLLLSIWSAPKPAWGGGLGLHFGFGHHGGHHGYSHNKHYRYFGRHSYPHYKHRYRYYGHDKYPHYGYNRYRYYGPNKYHHNKHYRYRNYSHHGSRGHYKYHLVPDHKSSSTDDRFEIDGTGKYESSYNRSGGWDLLKTGRAEEALNSFSTTAQANPLNGVPKVGYALAAADLERLDRGVWAMRRAVRFEPSSLHHVNVDASLRSKLENLVHPYKNSDFYSTEQDDAYFMLAALHYMMGDHNASKSWIEQASDGKTSTRKLHQLIEESVAGSQSP